MTASTDAVTRQNVVPKVVAPLERFSTLVARVRPFPSVGSQVSGDGPLVNARVAAESAEVGRQAVRGERPGPCVGAWGAPLHGMLDMDKCEFASE